MRKQFIPVNNDLNKAIAFANSLDSNFVKNNQMVKQSSNYINTLELIKNFQDEGWALHSVKEIRGKNRKISSHYVKMMNNKYIIKDDKNGTECKGSLIISNSCKGNTPAMLDFGVHRKVCSNGLYALDKDFSHKINHNEKNRINLEPIMQSINNKFNNHIQRFETLKSKQISLSDSKDLAFTAAKLVYTDDQLKDINIDDLLRVNRDEDKGDNLWLVYNRIQENLTKNIIDVRQDINVNKQLFQLAESFI